MSLTVGVIGLGMMGRTHLDAYAKLTNARVIAIADANLARLGGAESAAGNIKGQAQGAFDLSNVTRYASGEELIRDPDVQVVDICVWTHLHANLVELALAAGKHVLIEKPLTRTVEEAQRVVNAARNAKSMIMPAMCLRFWPAWEWLHDEVVVKQRFGKVLSADFRREASHPGGPFYSNGAQCGGALLDLHIHDVDFIHYCFGIPAAVTSSGYSSVSGEPDHVATQYHYMSADAPSIVTATGSWCYSPGFDFNMRFTINCERATVVYDLQAAEPLVVCAEGRRTAVALDATMGYEREIRYFIDQISAGQRPDRVTVEQAGSALCTIRAERESLNQRQRVSVQVPTEFRDNAASIAQRATASVVH
jgi:predicted dehydrogenase